MGISRCLATVAALTVALLAGRARGETWSERLGFPAEKTILIIDVREAGISWEMNEATRRLLTDGHATTASIVVTGPWFNDVAAWAKENPQHDIGVSIALTNPYSAIHWRFLSQQVSIPSLVDAYGFPRENRVQLAVCADPEDVRLELDSQIARTRDAGVRISHLTAYYGTVFCRTDLTAVYLDAAKRHWLPAPIVDLTPDLIEHFQAMGFPVDDELVEMISNHPLPKLDDIHFSPVADTYEQKRDTFCDLLKGLGPGLVQITLNPADDSAGLRLLDPNWQQRVWDAKLLSDPKVLELLRSDKFETTNWTDVMKRYETVPELTTKDEVDAE